MINKITKKCNTLNDKIDRLEVWKDKDYLKEESIKSESEERGKKTVNHISEKREPAQWLMPVILATWESESRRIVVVQG
jgi:hypothetical protein